MPFVRIDTIAGKYDLKQRAVISDVIYQAVLKIGALANDRFQVFAQHAAEDLIFNPDYLDIKRTDGFMSIQVTLVEGRSVEQKKLFVATIADELNTRIGVRTEDIFVSMVEVKKENWSFGKGVVQYADK